MSRAQEGGGVELRIQLRTGDGSAIAGEPVVLQRLPEEEEIVPACRTDAAGACVWRVRRGLYELLFGRPLDAVSALAVAEGGLRGLGITVGEVPITYHFTFYSDGRVYFDAAPEAAVPAPIIPGLDELGNHVLATTAPLAVSDDGNGVTPTPEPTATPSSPAPASPDPTWRFLLFIGLGLVVGGGLHFLRRRSEPFESLRAGSAASASRGQAWTQKRKQPDQPVTQEVEDA